MGDTPTLKSPTSAERTRSGLGVAALQRDIVDNLICLQGR
jgi:starch phosphorylase